MELINFIKENENWEEELKGVGIAVIKEDNLALIKYDHISTDFNHPIAEYCRGSIVDLENFKYVCKTFNKFWNLGEYKCAEIDWISATYMEKLDGSIMKLWFYEGEWRVSTNGTLDAYNASIRNNFFDGTDNFGQLFWKAWKNEGYETKSLSKECSYIFELCTPVNKVVVPHTEFNLYFLGQFENETAQEVIPIEHQFRTFKTYKFDNHEEASMSARHLPFTEEGYVVVDRYGKRCKIKSLAYISVHRLGDDTLTEQSLFNIVILREESEVLLYYPELGEKIGKMRKSLDIFLDKTRNVLQYIRENLRKPFGEETDAERKASAIYIVKNCPHISIGFAFLDWQFEEEELIDHLIKHHGFKGLRKYL